MMNISLQSLDFKHSCFSRQREKGAKAQMMKQKNNLQHPCGLQSKNRLQTASTLRKQKQNKESLCYSHQNTK